MQTIGAGSTCRVFGRAGVSLEVVHRDLDRLTDKQLTQLIT